MEKENAIEKDSWTDNSWIFIPLMMLLAFGFPSGTDHELREEVAELKGKMSVIEKIVLSDRGN